jgi:NAD(P)-dependent dehydrogenase (short-subunit alcohol dehydrogenase family)
MNFGDNHATSFRSSVNAKAAPLYGPYIAAKQGVEGLVRVLARELRGRNICVNAVAPAQKSYALPFRVRGRWSPQRVRKVLSMACPREVRDGLGLGSDPEALESGSQFRATTSRSPERFSK